MHIAGSRKSGSNSSLLNKIQQLSSCSIVPSEQASFNLAVFSEYSLLPVDWTEDILSPSYIKGPQEWNLAPKHLSGS